MKNIFFIVFTLSLTLSFSQVVELDQLESQFETMGEDLSSAVASSATTGLTWSDAYIGGLPHMGVGVFTGVSIIPVDGFNDVISVIDTGATLPSELTEIGGLPLPTVGVDARIGGLLLPFDIGVKYGVLSEFSIDKTTIDYNLVGADVRYALLDGGLILPNITVGVGFSRLTTDIKVSGLLGDNYTILSNPSGGEVLLKLQDPDLVYGWESNVIEFKAQISKSLIFITPYAGVNAAYGITKIGGGIKTAVLDNNGNVVDQEEIDGHISDVNTAGGNVPEIKTNGFETYSETTGMGVQIFGGASFNIFLLKIDISANYDLMSKTYGGQAGFRLQF